MEVVNNAPPGVESFGDLTTLSGNVSSFQKEREWSAGTKVGPVEFHFTSETNLTTNRVIAKTAFNYLCFCVIQSSREDWLQRLYGVGFNPLRCYILIPESEYKFGELVMPKPDKRIVFNGAEIRMGDPYHQIRIGKKNHYFDGTTGVPEGEQPVIFAQINLSSLTNYEVFLAFDQFLEIDSEIFGCAHLIDLANDRWIGLDANNNACGDDRFALIQGGKRRQATLVRAFILGLISRYRHGDDLKDWYDAEKVLGLRARPY